MIFIVVKRWISFLSDWASLHRQIWRSIKQVSHLKAWCFRVPIFLLMIGLSTKSDLALGDKMGLKKKAMKKEIAILAGGCFWGVEELIRQQKGVLETEVGYTGGVVLNPKYDQVKTGQTGHAEAIRIVFDPDQISYTSLLKYFFKIHDPTTLNQQGNDIGSQYRSAIFYENDKQKEIAESLIKMIDEKGVWKKKIVTELRKAGPFHSAETYHQDYLQKNPGGYTCHFERKISI
jgi:peptide-methionine (S)-S-oxide reductase